MREQRDSVPKWLVWSVPVLATVYLMLVAGWLWLTPSRLVWQYHWFTSLLLWPADLFVRTLVHSDLGMTDARWFSFGSLAALAALWEGLALIFGLGLYGLVGLVHLAVPEDRGEGRSE